MLYFHSNSANTTLSAVVACFKDTYAPTSRNYVSTEPKTRSFQYLISKIFRYHSPVFIFKKLLCFHWHCAKTTLSDTCDGSSQTRMYQPPENMFLLSPRQDLFSTETVKFVGSTLRFLYLKKLWYFHSNLANTTLSGSCGGSFQNHACTDFQKMCS